MRTSEGETALKGLVKEKLKEYKWFPRHIYQGKQSYKGVPDILATKDGKTVEIELKVGKNKQSEHQIKYQADLEAHGGTYLLIRDIDELERWLDGGVGIDPDRVITKEMK
jgi:hypothetical protein